MSYVSDIERIVMDDAIDELMDAWELSSPDEFVFYINNIMPWITDVRVFDELEWLKSVKQAGIYL